ncbi:MAG: hypothetical protein CL793_07310 [Chloroflexi bacterium]|nr:hypothetical protein [Chloroflexota bacterium]
MRVKTPEKEQLGLLHHSTKLFTNAIYDLSKAQILGDMQKEKEAFERLKELIGESMAIANLLGRRRMWLMAQSVKKRNKPYEDIHLFSSEDLETPVVPHVPFEAVIDDLLGREAKVVSDEALALRRGYEEVQKIYLESHAFALARHSNLEITKNIQKKIGDLRRTGTTTDEASYLIAAMGNWARGYGEVVYRTNLNPAYNSGIKEMAVSDPAVSDVVGAFRYMAVRDADTRPGHKAASGLIASIHDPIWEYWTPPLGYNCRCSLIMVDKFRLEREGLIEPNGTVKVHTPPNWDKAKPDPGFGKPGFRV